MPNGNLKNILTSYVNTIGNDPNLSYRQIYNDIGAAFEQNPNLNSTSEFSKVQLGLDILFNNSNLITSNLKDGTSSYKPGVFMTDSKLVYGLSQLTGSYSEGAAASMGIDLIADILNSSSNPKNTNTEQSASNEINNKFISDYEKLAEISSKTIYTELDSNLNKALIDAMIHIESNHMVTSIYRYDFENGASLKVENDILKYINPNKNLVKNLCKVEQRHDMKFHKENFHPYGEINREISIAIGPNDSTFYIFTGKNVITGNKCKDCFPEKSGYRIESATGQILNEIHRKVFSVNLNNVRKMNYTSNKFIIWEAWLPRTGIGEIPTRPKFYKKTYGFQERDFYLKKVDGNYSFLDDGKFFNFNGTKEKITQNVCDTRKDKNNYIVIEHENFLISLFFGNVRYANNGPMFSSSIFQISNLNNFYNVDGMVNELTGIAKNKNGVFYFTNSFGQIGKLENENFKPDDQEITNKIRSSFGNKILKPYEFIAERSFISIHGNYLSSDETGTIFPILKLTPDEKWLVYISNDNLSIINPENLNEVYNYKLTFPPTNSFFGKENGDYTLFVQGYDDYKFFVTKKYSIKKLASLSKPKINLSLDKKEILKTNNPTNSKKSIIKKDSKQISNFSVADEIKKLKELKDSGAITSEEYETAKKKILNN